MENAVPNVQIEDWNAKHKKECVDRVLNLDDFSFPFSLMSETHENLIASLLNSLEIDPEHKLSEEEGDCCPICLEDLIKTERNCIFICCGKRICEICNGAAVNSMTKLPNVPTCNT